MAEEVTNTFDPNAPRFKSPLELDKLALYTKPASANDRTAKLVWSVVFNHPRLTLFTNKKELENKENGWGRIIARLDILVAQSIIESLRSMVDAEPGTRMVIKNINYPINEGKRSETPVHVNDVILGKDKEGLIWISVVEENKPNIKFNIIFSDYHELFHGDGTAFTAKESSELATKAYCNILEKMLSSSYFLPDQLAILNTSSEDKKNMFNTKGSYKKQLPNKPNMESAAISEDDFPF